MAITNELPVVEPASSSASSSPSDRRKRSVQVATNNSATFIQFPTNPRQVSSFVPISRPRTSQSSVRLPSHTIDTQSVSNQSKSSANAPSSSATSDDHKRSHSQQRINPILSNPLLNHRKEQPKSPPIKSSTDYSRTTRLSLSSRPLKSTFNDTHVPVIRARTAPLLAHPNETNISDRFIIPLDKLTSEKQIPHVDVNKYDYITRWLNEIRAATYSSEPFRTKSKRTKRRLTPSSS